MTQEDLFRTAYYAKRSGYLNAIKDIFDVLALVHHVPGTCDRKTIDIIWEHTKRLEELARETPPKLG